MTLVGQHGCIDSSVQGEHMCNLKFQSRKFPGVIHRETLHVKMRQEGEQLLRCALEGFQKQLGESHPQAGMRSCQLGNLAGSDPKR